MLDLKEIQKQIQKFWQDNKIYEKLLARPGKKFYFLDGPPYANDIPHIGHIKNSIIKDITIRQKFMQGYNVFFKPGFDTHGLPIEHAMEKSLKLNNKKDILKYGLSRFLTLCKKNATLNMELWMMVYKQLGSLYSLKKPYLTYDNSYIESGWWTFKRWYEKNLIYESEKPVFYCPRCQTSLAGYEVTDSYKQLEDPSIYILFKLKARDEYILVWTTTPWTLISNVAIAIREDADYVKVKLSDGKLIWLAESRLPILNDLDIKYDVVEKTKGKSLIGLDYEPLLNVPIQQELENMKLQQKEIHKIIPSIRMLKERTASKTAEKKHIEQTELYEDFVVLNEGTGAVHTAPGHGKTDFMMGQHYKLPAISPVNEEGKFNEKAGFVKGTKVREASKIVVEKLKHDNKILAESKVTHNYPVCWRCKTPLITILSKQYFVNIEKIKNRMLEYTEKVTWLPDFTKTRFLNWVSNAEDWNISRQRYWGTPMPIWKCSNKKCSEVKVIGSFSELKEEVEKSGKTLNDNFDLHNISSVELVCSSCGNKMKPINQVFDVWFDSGVSAWASVGYPYHDNNIFDKIWPVDRINEGQDQIRGWFYHLMLCGATTFNTMTYNTVSMVGWVVDSKGKKMSKSLGNVVYAKDALDSLGADILRFYMLWDSAPYGIQSFNEDIAKKEIGKFFNTLINIVNFFVSINTPESKNKSTMDVEDIWIISRLNNLIKQYSEYINKFELHKAMRLMYDFVLKDLSRIYIKIIRSKASEKKYLLYMLINNILKLLAPIAPFTTEWLYQKLEKQEGKESIHLCNWPKYDNKVINDKVEKLMENCLGIIENVLSLRSKLHIGVRWPLAKMIIFSKDDNIKKSIEMYGNIIKQQANVKQISIKEEISEVEKKHFKDSMLMANDTTIIIDTTTTPKIEAEGYARELCRKVQDARKKKGLNKNDKIILTILCDEKMYGLLTKQYQEEFIKQRTNAKEITIQPIDKAKAEIELKNKSEGSIKQEEFIIGFEKI